MNETTGVGRLRPSGPTVTLRRFGALFGLGATGVLALFLTADPSAYRGPAEEAGLAVETLLLIAAVQSLILLAVAVVVGLYLAPRVGLRSHVANRVSRGTALRPALRPELEPALAVGGAVGVLLLIAERVAPVPLDVQPEATVGGLIETLPMRVLYGGITEELLLRWAVMSVLVFVLWRTLGRGTDRPSARIGWAAIVVAAVLFGVGHLPAAPAVYGALTPDVVTFVILGNGLAGLGFGWLFCRHSLEAAMVAHGFAHVVAVSGGVVTLVL